MEWQKTVKKYPLIQKLFSSLEDVILQQCLLMTYHKNDFLCHKGTPITKCQLILSGHLSVYNEFENGKIYNIEDIHDGMIIGEMEISAHFKTYTASVAANTDTDVLVFPVSVYQHLMNTSLPFIQGVNTRLGSMLCQLSNSHGENLVYPAKDIIARFLIRTAEEANSDPCVIKETREAISEKTGLSLRSVQRAIKSFADRGMITLDKGKINVTKVQINALKRM